MEGTIWLKTSLTVPALNVRLATYKHTDSTSFDIADKIAQFRVSSYPYVLSRNEQVSESDRYKNHAEEDVAYVTELMDYP